jgi:heme-degrading monooxygenase HmoA
MNTKTVSAVLAFGLLITVADSIWYQTPTVSARSTKIRRTILLNFKPEASAAQIQEALKDVKKNISGLKGVHGLFIGPQINERASFKYGISMDFDDEAALKAYRADEEHRQTHNKYNHLIEAAQITDIRDE